MFNNIWKTYVQVERKRKELQEIRGRAKRGLLSNLKNGNLEAIASQMEQDLNAAADLVTEQAIDINEVKARARTGLLDAFRTGDLETLAREMDTTEVEMEQDKMDLAELKLRSRQALLAAHKSWQNVSRSKSINSI